MVAAVFGCDQFKFELAGVVCDRIADGDAVIAIPESHAIEKAFGVFVGELQRPGFAGVGGFVDARLVAGSGAEQVGEVGAEGFYVAEVESFGAGDLGGLPGVCRRRWCGDRFRECRWPRRCWSVSALMPRRFSVVLDFWVVRV